jgi:RNA-directed DNA polymerase
MHLPDPVSNQSQDWITAGEYMFSRENIASCENHILAMQERLDKAVANGNNKQVKRIISLLSEKSNAVKIVAINKICNLNSGRYTAGIDKLKMPSSKKERLPLLLRLLESVNVKSKPSPCKRVYITKPDGSLRGLGIPTIKDRIAQDIIRMSIEPVCEHHFLTCSYGFRPLRSCHDAVEDLFGKLCRKHSRKWVLEGDIEKCFDNLSHKTILATLESWNIPKSVISIIKSMLEIGILEECKIIHSQFGTPQGGVISPLLANVALHKLDCLINERYKIRNNIPIVRFADDFVISCQNEKECNLIKEDIKAFLPKELGVKLSDKKTFITNIEDGFDFLGFNFRKYSDILLIKPCKSNISDVIESLKLAYKDTSISTGDLILKLNRITIGWGNYYRHCIAKKTFSYISMRTWSFTRKWLRKKFFPLTKREWKKYFTSINKDKWVLQDPVSKRFLVRMNRIKIIRFVKIKKDVRVYDKDNRAYWESRKYIKNRDLFSSNIESYNLYIVQKGKCVFCNQSITELDIVERKMEKHHLLPQSKGGTRQLRNLRLLHSDCHSLIHQRYTRDEMAKYQGLEIDYLRLSKSQVIIIETESRVR